MYTDKIYSQNFPTMKQSLWLDNRSSKCRKLKLIVCETNDQETHLTF